MSCSELTVTKDDKDDGRKRELGDCSGGKRVSMESTGIAGCGCMNGAGWRGREEVQDEYFS